MPTPPSVSDGAFASANSPAFLEKVYQELRLLAGSKMSHESEPQTLQPTALVHEAWIRMGGDQSKWENTSHFFAAAAQAMRRILIERARRGARVKHGGGQLRVELDELGLLVATSDERILLINDALERLKIADAAKAEIVELKFFAGLTNAEVGRLLNVTERTVERQWAFAKAWLYSAIDEGVRAEGANRGVRK